MSSEHNPSDYFKAEGHLKAEFTKTILVLIFFT